MKFDWETDAKRKFRREILTSTHDGHLSPEFTDDGLAAILDAYPRDRLGIFSFPPHAEGRVLARHGRASDHTGAELVEAVKTGHIWLNLRAVNHHLPVFETFAQDIFSQLEAATGECTFKRDVGLLISSPNIHVHYHLDVPMVVLVQMRGVKTLHLYPASAPFAPPEQIEAVVLREREEDIVFRNSFEEQASVLELHPGQALTWPQNAPHRVQNSDMMNVSLSCEFMTPAALLRANAIYTNGYLRRKFNAQPQLPTSVGPSLLARAVMARAIKVFHKAPEKGPTPVSFELDRNSNDLRFFESEPSHA